MRTVRKTQNYCEIYIFLFRDRFLEKEVWEPNSAGSRICAASPEKNFRFWISDRRILVQTGCFFSQFTESWFKCRSHCQNNFGNAVPRRSRWKRSLFLFLLLTRTFSPHDARSAKRGIAIVSRPYVRLSVTLMYRGPWT